MADNYFLFIEEIKTESDDAAKWIEKRLEAAREDDEGGICAFEREGTKVWVYSEEYADMNRLVDILAEYQKTFGDQKAIVLTWAYTCSKPRPGEFGGGAAVIVGGKIESLETRDWADKLARELVPGHGKEEKA